MNAGPDCHLFITHVFTPFFFYWGGGGGSHCDTNIRSIIDMHF